MGFMVSSGKAKAIGAYFLINTLWCSDVATLASNCSLDLEYLTVKCRPYYLPREFPSAILTAVYLQPHVDVENALDKIYTAINTPEIKSPELLFIVACDFNQANLKQVMPKYHQHISCPDRGPNILDHCYTTIKDAYGSIPHSQFGKSHQNAVFLLLAYKQKLKQENPSWKEVQCWSQAAGDRLQDCWESLDWTVFEYSVEYLNEYIVMDFI
eukprot:g35235.t1